MLAPIAAPTTLPMPPTITTTSEASSMRMSSPGTMESSTAPITPPKPARPAPLAKGRQQGNAPPRPQGDPARADPPAEAGEARPDGESDREDQVHIHAGG